MSIVFEEGRSWVLAADGGGEGGKYLLGEAIKERFLRYEE